HQVLPYAIEVLQRAGYKLVTLATCLGLPAYHSVGKPGTPDICSYPQSHLCISLTLSARLLGPAERVLRPPYTPFIACFRWIILLPSCSTGVQ
ncbi:hypothetical protein B0H11DRAFT_1745275, partial [Mycena galericulata]